MPKPIQSTTSISPSEVITPSSPPQEGAVLAKKDKGVIDSLIQLTRLANYRIEHIGKDQISTDLQGKLLRELFNRVKGPNHHTLPEVNQLQMRLEEHFRYPVDEAGGFAADIVDNILFYLHILFFLDSNNINVAPYIDYHATKKLLLDHWEIASHQSRFAQPSGSHFYECDSFTGEKERKYSGPDDERRSLEQLGHALSDFNRFRRPSRQNRLLVSLKRMAVEIFSGKETRATPLSNQCFGTKVNKRSVVGANENGSLNQKVIDILWDLHLIYIGEKTERVLTGLPESVIDFLSITYSQT